jgi:uncharacterized delta-60 repeat protein
MNYLLRFLLLFYYISTQAQHYIPDSSFGGKGWLEVPMPGKSFLTDCVVDSQQRIVSLGLEKQNGVYNLWLSRLFLNGQTDSSFGQFGKKVISLRLNRPQLVNGKLILMPDQKMLIVANGMRDGGPKSKGYLIRLLENGEEDLGFGQNGFLELRFDQSSNLDNGIFSVILKKEGSILGFGGYSSGLSTGNGAYFFKVNADGKLDSTFGNYGISAKLNSINIPPPNFSVEISEDSLNRIFIPDFSGVLVYLPNGTIDTTLYGSLNIGPVYRMPGKAFVFPDQSFAWFGTTEILWTTHSFFNKYSPVGVQLESYNLFGFEFKRTHFEEFNQRLICLSSYGSAHWGPPSANPILQKLNFSGVLDTTFKFELKLDSLALQGNQFRLLSGQKILVVGMKQNGIIGDSTNFISLWKPDSINTATTKPRQFSFSLYPNPGKDGFFLSLPQIDRRAKVTMTHALGRKVKEMEMIELKPFVSTSGLAKGIYQVQVETERQVFSQRWVLE